MAKSLSTTVVQYCCAAPSCGKIYNSRCALKRHCEVTHMKRKQATCPECGRTFATRQNLKEHSFLHSTQKAFECSECGKRFKQGCQLSLHKRKHVVGIECNSPSDSEAESVSNAWTENLPPQEGEVRLPVLPLLSQDFHRRKQR